MSRLTPLALLTGFMMSGNVAGENIGSQTGANITLNDGDILTGDATYSGGLYGVVNPYNQTGIVNLGRRAFINVTDADNYARGVVIWGNESQLFAEGLTLNISGNSALGINITGQDITADLGTGTTVNVTGTATASGILIRGASSLKAEALTVNLTGDGGFGLSVSNAGTRVDLGSGSTLSTQGRGSHAIRVHALNGRESSRRTSLTANQLTLNTTGDSAYGLNLQADSLANLGSGSTITTTGANAFGIWNFGELAADNLTINTTGSGSVGLEVRQNGVADIGPGSHVTSEQAGSIVASGTSAIINYKGTAEQRNSLHSGGAYAASAQTPGSSVTLDETDITSADMALWALNEGHISANNVSISSSVTPRAALYAMTGGEINLTGNVDIAMASADQFAIATQYNEGYAQGVVNIDGKLNMTGSVYSRGGFVDLALQPGSVWQGAAISDGVNKGYLNTTLDKSDWYVSANSNVDRLNMNKGQIDFTRPISASDYSTLTVADLSGSGNFNMRVDPVGEGDGVNNRGDKLVVTNSSQGDFTLSFVNQGSLATTGHELLTVAETPDGIANFTTASDIELGGYLYSVRKTGTNWELYSSSAASAPEPEPAPDPAPDPAPAPQPAPEPEPEPEPAPTPPITTTADAGGNFLHISYLMNYVETQTLFQRLGDIRQDNAKGNVWLRGFGGKLNTFSGGRLSKFEMGYSGYQFGADKHLADDINVSGGLFMGTTHASPHYRGGEGTAKSEHVGGYLTWVADNGFYIDQVVKINRIRNQFMVKDSQQNLVSGQAKSTGFTFSVEAGRRFHFSPDDQGFYLEPQAQITAGRQKGSQTRASNGLVIAFKDYDSVNGRAGALAGYSQKSGATNYTVYFKTGVEREFSASMQYALNGSTEKADFSGNALRNGLGVSADIDTAHHLYLEADLTTGQRFDQRQLNAGYRFSF
ncbi:autotransporter outer membrane beta-barrel domain-containing protein [Pantoea anthophila]|uniref:autotransporter outer membrane beta-barrel domain-containing protein n=1 Tax=Pantoea anthophila TaxID=470931 RepID=UPI002DBDC380|nr:autotransporter outer membrane beta-barrel domain-containing protein [Pantoea anthophila]MEB6223425.1 autotransporter outer membrane beta-barrel domain-containing protein [Pantoea anthophila]